MPEYLAPAVYVEEVDTGSKPIEGVSTSTAGVIGVTERGPINVPLLVTSYGEYRWNFGDQLNRDLYGNQCYLPQAVEGFFTNGGKRLYVTRLLDRGAARLAERTLVAPIQGAPLATQLARNAPAGGAAEITVIDDPGFAVGNTLQIDEAVAAEFRTINAAPVATNLVSLNLPLGLAHPAATTTVQYVTDPPVAGAAAAAYNSTLRAPANAGQRNLLVVNATPVAPGVALAAGDLLQIDAGAEVEYVYVASVQTATNTITLNAPLQLSHLPTAATPINIVRMAAVAVVPPPGAAPVLAGAGSAVGDVLADITNPPAAGSLLRFLDATAVAPDMGISEIRRVTSLSRVALTPPPAVGVTGGATYAQYPAGSIVERIPGAIPAGTIQLAAAAPRGSTSVQLGTRVGLNPGDVLAIGAGANRELVEIASLPSPVPNPNPGNAVLRAPLRRDQAAGANVVATLGAPGAPNLQGVVVSTAPVDSNDIIVSMPAGLVANDILRVRTAGGGVFYHEAQGAPAAVNPRRVPLDNPLAQAHGAGATVTLRAPMMDVVALDPGQWGNRLRVGMEEQPEPLLQTRLRQPPASNVTLRLGSTAGVEIGTELVITDAAGNESSHKVANIDRQNDYLITLEATTPLPGGVGVNDRARTREYRFIVELLRQEDPATPSRNSQAIDREVRTNLSLDPRHSRYFQQVIGATWDIVNPATAVDDGGRALRRWDRRSEGDSAYVRVFDHAPGHGLRAPPVPAYENRPGATPRLILLPLGGGDDQLGNVGDPAYIGADDPNPELRTGLHTLRNVDEISIVAAPGRTTAAVQLALINHCELMRYRFAVLDGTPPPDDSMQAIQYQRQQFDTKYAALYHPWLLIPDPYPLNPAAPPDYPIPPSGHMLGIYARTDIERGVHKAPANEVVRGVIGLQRVLNKEQQDILNPYPVNINVIRDFRTNNRGIRVYGGRCITSDSDWKYVNVRRLLIFIEASIDRGLQWVVFEPNAEPLWARVRRAITNFLTVVWRNGALEGTKVEEAFFVKCDRTTMTQTDIDSGRLICLVGVAPVKPAEFVIVRIGLWTAHAAD